MTAHLLALLLDGPFGGAKETKQEHLFTCPVGRVCARPVLQRPELRGVSERTRQQTRCSAVL